MILHPNFETFEKLAGSFNMVPVYRQLTSDSLTPVSAFRRLGGGPWSFLFESVIGGEKVGRYSFIGINPFMTFQATGPKVRIVRARPGEEKPTDAREFNSANPFDDLDRLIQAYKAPHLPGLPRFHGGAVGYASYDSIRYLEHLPNTPPDDRNIPDLSFGFYDQMVVFDNVRKLALVVALANVADKTPREAYDEAAARVNELTERLRQNSGDLPAVDIDTQGNDVPAYKSNFTREGFISAIEKCKEYIRAGDFFQIVISQRFEIETQAPPMEIYRTLRVVNPSPFMVYMETPQSTLVASSPEIMVRVENRIIETRPLAGTRRRGASEAEDRALEEELLADPKERAEHIMLVDLGRNDVGRVSEYQSVVIEDVMTVERYSHVMHITSDVKGKLREGLTPLAALKACLPAGTVSGAPKVRAMEVIDEVEPTKRGPYAGAIGYVDFTGNMDTCIALRTMVIAKGKAYVQAGMGLVYDSDPAAEYQETLDKARGLMRAVWITEKRVGRQTDEGHNLFC